MGLALSRAAGQPFTDLVHRHIFEPLGMETAREILVVRVVYGLLFAFVPGLLLAAGFMVGALAWSLAIPECPFHSAAAAR